MLLPDEFPGNLVLTNFERRGVFSQCQKYRYALEINFAPPGYKFGNGKYVNFLMLNPSTADTFKNDPTVERCCRRASVMGYSGIVVTNLFAYRATNPKDMREQNEPIGEWGATGNVNDYWIEYVLSQCEMTVCGWGGHGRFMSRAEAVRKILERYRNKVYFIRLTKHEREPVHPLYLGYSETIKPYLV